MALFALLQSLLLELCLLKSSAACSHEAVLSLKSASYRSAEWCSHGRSVPWDVIVHYAEGSTKHSQSIVCARDKGVGSRLQVRLQMEMRKEQRLWLKHGKSDGVEDGGRIEGS